MGDALELNGSLQALSLHEVCARLRLEEAFRDILERGWDASGRALAPDRLDFLQPSYVAETCAKLHMNDDLSTAISTTAAVIRGDEALARLAWHIYWAAFEDPEAQNLSPAWPPMREALRLPYDLFYAVVIMGAVPQAQEAYRKRGIPHEIIEESLGDIRVKILYHKECYGEFGLLIPSFNFFRRLITGEMIQLGRFQFHYNPFRGRLRAYRNVADGGVIALSEPNIRYRSDGELYVEARNDNADGAWTASLTETERWVTGHPITPKGKGIETELRLDKEAWHCVLAPGDPVMQIHIPGGTPMEHAACGESLQRARDVFARCYSEHAFKAFACSSWLLDDQLEAMLPPESNLVRFLREVYRFPTSGTTDSSLRWIFGTSPKDLTKAPRNTTLRRRVIDHVLAGGHLYGGGSFLLIDDLAWGSQVYRRQDLSEIFHQD